MCHGRYGACHDEENRALPRPVSEAGGRSSRYRERWAALLELLSDQTLSPQDLYDRCARLEVTSADVTAVLAKLAPSPQLVAAARWVIRNGTDRSAILVAPGLLCGNAEQHDIPVIRVVGQSRLAVKVLTKIPGAARDVIWLAERSRDHARLFAVQALVGHADPWVREWVLSTPPRLLSSDLALSIAQEHGLADLLESAVDDSRWDQAGHLLLAMTDMCGYRAQISRYEQTPVVCQRWRGAERQPWRERRC
jgi:hypothetical protein